MDRLPDTPRFCQGGFGVFFKIFSCKKRAYGCILPNRGEVFYNMIKLVLLLIFFLITLYFIEKLLVKYKKFNSIIRWLLFLPVSILRAFSCVMIISILFQGIFEINDTILSCVLWSMSPIILLLTINKTIPAKNRIIINTLGVLWIAGSIYEIIINSGNTIARIIQIISMAVYIAFQNKTWNGEKNNQHDVKGEKV